MIAIEQIQQITSTFDMNLILSTVEMLKNSKLKQHLFYLSCQMNRMAMQSYLLNTSSNQAIIMEYISEIKDYSHIILTNIDDWIRNYNSQLRMSMKKELASGLIQIKQMLKNIVE
jgi:hypothetical protein